MAWVVGGSVHPVSRRASDAKPFYEGVVQLGESAELKPPAGSVGITRSVAFEGPHGWVVAPHPITPTFITPSFITPSSLLFLHLGQESRVRAPA